MGVIGLKCRGCGETYGAEARYVCTRCFGPVEVAYDHAALAEDPAALRRRIQAGPAEPVALRGPAAGGRPGDRRPAAAGPARRSCAPTGWPSASGWARCGSRTTPPTRRTRSRTAWWRSRARGGPASSASTRWGCCSTGNLANAVAARAAALGLPSYVFIPSDLEEQKVLGNAAYGTTLVKVRGAYDDVNRLVTEVSGEREGWAFVNVNLRPYYAEGSKTIAYEVAEQLGWELPDRVVAPIASGSLFTKVAKGFAELRDLGLVDGALPAMQGAQATGCAPVASAWARGDDRCVPVKPHTIAKSLAIGSPADGPYALFPDIQADSPEYIAPEDRVVIW